MPITIIGDLMLGRGVAPLIKYNGLDYFFSDINKYFGSSKYIANLESPLTKNIFTNKSDQVANFKASPYLAKSLNNNNVIGLNLANNHIFDCGLDGLLETTNVLNNSDIKFCGAGKNIYEAKKPMIITNNNVRYGFLSFSYRPIATKNKFGINYLYGKTIYDDINK